MQYFDRRVRASNLGSLNLIPGNKISPEQPKCIIGLCSQPLQLNTPLSMKTSFAPIFSVVVIGTAFQVAIAQDLPASKNPDCSSTDILVVKNPPQQPVDRNPCSVLVYVTNPWLMVIGSDEPVFALYDDGTVIYHSNNEDSGERFLTTKLSVIEKQEILVLVSKLAGAKNSYSVSRSTEQPSNKIFVSTPTLKKTVRVYGNLKDDETAAAESKKNGVPDTVINTLKRLSSFKHDKATPWSPEFIEVMIWPFGYSKDKPVNWPPGWPV